MQKLKNAYSLNITKMNKTLKEITGCSVFALQGFVMFVLSFFEFDVFGT